MAPRVQKEVILDGSVAFAATITGPERPTLETATALWLRAVRLASRNSAGWAWIEFVAGGLIVHWLEPKDDGQS